MKWLLLLIFLWGCSNDSTQTTTTTNEDESTQYSAELGVPSQSLLPACAGVQALIRPVLRCFKKNSSVQVNNSFCLSLDPQYMNIPSPAGQKTITIPGGYRFETCSEGSSDIISTTYSCNPGFFLKDLSCQNFASVGNYFIQKDQIYRSSSNLQILYTIGHDFSNKINNGLNLIMILE